MLAIAGLNIQQYTIYKWMPLSISHKSKQQQTQALATQNNEMYFTRSRLDDEQ